MAASTAVAAIEGCVDDGLRFHLDAENDVLYLTRAEFRNQATYGEETPEGFTLLRTADGIPAGMTVVNYWRDFGKESVDSTTMRLIKEQISVWVSGHFHYS